MNMELAKEMQLGGIMAKIEKRAMAGHSFVTIKIPVPEWIVKRLIDSNFKVLLIINPNNLVIGREKYSNNNSHIEVRWD